MTVKTHGERPQSGLIASGFSEDCCLKRDAVAALLVSAAPSDEKRGHADPGDRSGKARPGRSPGPGIPLERGQGAFQAHPKTIWMTPIAAVMRPCEIRAFVELVKLKQGSTEEVLLIGIDCMGAYGNTDYARFADVRERRRINSRLLSEGTRSGRGTIGRARTFLPHAKSCEYPCPGRRRHHDRTVWKRTFGNPAFPDLKYGKG